MKRIPAALQTASVPPTVVAPSAPCTTATARSRGPSLRADGVEARELVLGQPDADLAVEHADRRRHRAAVAHRLLGGEPDLDALAGREAVGDERRLERDDAAALAQRLLDLVGDADHGIAPSGAQQRAAASRPSSGPPSRKPAASASPAPVVSTTLGRRSPGSARPSTQQAARAALQHPARVELADRVLLALGREDELGRERAQPRAERVVDQRPGGDVDRRRSRRARGRARAACAAAEAIGSRSSE